MKLLIAGVLSLVAFNSQAVGWRFSQANCAAVYDEFIGVEGYVDINSFYFVYKSDNPAPYTTQEYYSEATIGGKRYPTPESALSMVYVKGGDRGINKKIYQSVIKTFLTEDEWKTVEVINHANQDFVWSRSVLKQGFREAYSKVKECYDWMK